MTDRSYKILLGVLLLVCLYFELGGMLYTIIGLLFFEGITNLRIPKLICAIRNCITEKKYEYFDPGLVINPRLNIDSEQVWRVIVGVLLLVGYSLNESMWFFPWFLGFAIFGAGISGVCPVLLAIRWAGFK